MKPGTQSTLITDLEQKPNSHAVNIIKERARNGEYHDLKSELPCPKILLHRDLLLADCEDLARKTFEGEYDELEG